MAPTALCLSFESSWRSLLDKALPAAGFQAQWASDPQDARTRLQSAPPEVLLADASIALDDRFDILGCARQGRRQPQIALIGDQDIEEGFFALRRSRVGVFYSRRRPPAPESIERDLRYMLHPGESFGLEKHLPDGAEVERRPIRTLAEKNAIVEGVCKKVEGLARRFPSVFDIRLAYEEIINNSIMHAFHRRDGSEKYSLREFVSLAPEESIEAAYSVGPWWVALSVKDNQGSLRLETILEKLHRQMSLIGLMDVNGRGLYLSLTLATRLIVSLAPGESSEIMTIFDARHQSQEKNLCVFEKVAAA